MTIQVDHARSDADFDELWLGWHGAAQAVRAALAGVDPAGSRPRVPSPRTPEPDLESALSRMHEHQRALGQRVSDLETDGASLPGCRTALAEMVLILAQLRRHTISGAAH